jgi:hypothetical protein
MSVAMKNAVFWDVTPCYSGKNRCLGGKYRIYHQGDKNRLLVTATFLVHRLLSPDDGGGKFLRNFSSSKCHIT